MTTTAILRLGAPQRRLYGQLARFLRPHRWRMAGTIVFSVIAAALDAFSFTLLWPFLNTLFGIAPLAGGTPKGNTSLLGEATKGNALLHLLVHAQDALVGAFIIPGDQKRSLAVFIIAIVVLTLIKNVFIWMAGQLGASLQEYVTRDLRDAVFIHMARLPLGFFHRTKTGQIIARILTDTEQTKALITELVTKSIQNVAQIVVTVGMLIAMSPRLAAVSLVIAPLLTLALQPILQKLRRGHRHLRNEYGEITSVLQEAVSGIRLVKSFGAEPYEDSRFVQASHGYSNGMIRMSRIALLSQPFTEMIGTGIAVLILWMGAQQVLTKQMDAGMLITFMILVMRLLPLLKQLSQTPATAQQSFAAAERLFEVLDQPTEMQVDRGTIVATPIRESITFDQVTFAYDDEPVLSDISFEARRGAVVALVGPSGAGKTTLVDLIARFYEPKQGRILLDGVDARQLQLASLRALTGIVSQDTVLFNDSVRNNIAYGTSLRFTDAQIEVAARAANAHEFIAELPRGYDTILGERGARLSGGQRQRIAIARALLVDPPILILDEATSALDTESERLVQEAIDRLLAGRTVFVIAHRLSTVIHADLILVLDRGRIVERGTHEQLLLQRGPYHRLHALQFHEQRAPVPV